MFSNKKKNNLEELRRDKEILEKIVKAAAENSVMYDANCGEMESSRRQMEADVCQSSDNLQSCKDMIGQNIRMENALCEELRAAGWAMEQSEQEYRMIVEQLRRQTELFLGLVEQNKHFTSPSKYLSENSVVLNSWNQESQRQLLQIQEDAAGLAELAERAEAEELPDIIKQYAANCQESTEKLLQHERKAEAKIAKLEEQTRYLVALLKENNISTGRILKENQTTVRMVEKSSIRPYSGDVAAWREQILGIRNAEEEVLKTQERNQILMEDITTELGTQRKRAEEISGEMLPMFSEAKDYLQ